MTVLTADNPNADKFVDPEVTADGSPRAYVAFEGLQTLWVNTGTLCNIECLHCYIESSPSNDRLAYITVGELQPFLSEANEMGAMEIGFTGGEPFMNPDMLPMAEAALAAGFTVLILTNAMKPMMRPRVQSGLLGLQERYGDQLRLRVSLDHYDGAIHDCERGAVSFKAALEGLAWLAENRFQLSVAGRAGFGQGEADIRAGFAKLFADIDIDLDADDPASLVLFPEMDEAAAVPEITASCWSILDKDPRDVMCSNARMLVKRKGDSAPTVLACTLIPYDERFAMGESLKAASDAVSLNHPHCAKFCVLGGASCSA